jgi:DNA-binding MarR family transcriptional regulator
LGITNQLREDWAMDPTADRTIDLLDEDALLDALVQMSFTVIGIISTVAARHGLSLTLLRVGTTLRNRTLTMSELALYLGLDRSTVTGLITRAEERGFVARIESETDKRSSRVMLTGAGQDLSATCAAEIAVAIEPVVAPLSTADRRRLDRLLRATSRIGRQRERVDARQDRSDQRKADRGARR